MNSAPQSENPLRTIALAIVSPMANESDSAVSFVREVLLRCEGFRQVEYFVVLDRASKDNTIALLEEYARVEPRLRVVWAPENRCVVDAYVRGYREALGSQADWILEIDAGFSHQPGDIPKLFAQMAAGNECVFGTRFAKGGKIQGSSLKRKLLSRGGTVITNLILKTRFSDMTSGFQLFRREILAKILQKGIHSRGPFFQTEMKAYCTKLRVAEVPITYAAASHMVGANSIRESFEQLRRLKELKAANELYL